MLEKHYNYLVTLLHIMMSVSKLEMITQNSIKIVSV